MIACDCIAIYRIYAQLLLPPSDHIIIIKPEMDGTLGHKNVDPVGESPFLTWLQRVRQRNRLLPVSFRGDLQQNKIYYYPKNTSVHIIYPPMIPCQQIF